MEAEHDAVEDQEVVVAELADLGDLRVDLARDQAGELHGALHHLDEVGAFAGSHQKVA